MRSVLLGAVALAFASTASHGAYTVIDGPVEAKVDRVIDGDTLEFTTYPWPDEQKERVQVRVRDIDTPETRTACQAEKTMGVAARKFVEDLVKQANERARLTVIGCKPPQDGGFGRCLAHVYVGGVSISKALLDRGLARPTKDGSDKTPWPGCE